MKYLASPYTDDDVKVMDARYNAVCRQTANMMKQGINMYSPIVHNAPLLKYGLTMNWDFWKDFDFHAINQCEELLALKLPGWEDSKGMDAEIMFASERYIPITYLEPDADVMDEITKVKLEWD